MDEDEERNEATEEFARRLYETMEHFDPSLDGTGRWEGCDQREADLYRAVATTMLDFYVLKRPATAT